MYGLVNAAVQDLVVSKFGEEKWNEMKALAEIDVQDFLRMEQYPDEVTYKLVDAATKVLGIPGDDVLKAFGEFWVLYSGRAGYGHLFTIAGDSLKDFLFSLDDLHTRIGQNFKQLRPPSFSFDELDDGDLRMHYHTERAGLCPFVEGLLKGLSLHFKTPVAIKHPVCRREGADHCEFILHIGEPGAAT